MIRGALLAWLALATTAAAAAPQRIVTLSPHLAELVCDAGACNRLVGVSAYTRFPPQVRDLPVVGDAFSIDLEAVVARRPDLVLAWDEATPRAVVERLRRLGVRVLEPHIVTLDDIAAALRQLGAVLDTAATADAAARSYESRLQSLRAAHAHATPLRVFFQVGTNPAYTVSRRSTVSAALTACGAENVFAGLPGYSAPVSAEAVLAAAPQVVLYDRETSRAAIDAYWARLPTVPAVRHGNLYPVDTNALGVAAPRVLGAIGDVCRQLDAVRTAQRSSLRRQLTSAPPS